MTISFNHKSKLSTVGSGNYVFRHYGASQPSQPYTFYEYLKSTGSQCIVTDYSLTSSSRVYIEFTTTNWEDQGGYCGCNGGGNNYYIAVYNSGPYSSTHNLAVRLGSVRKFSTPRALGVKNIVDINNGGYFYINGTRYAKGTYLGSNGANFAMFSYNGTSGGVVGDRIIYNCKVYLNGSTLSHDYVAAKNNYTNEYGMYDKVTGDFLTGSSTGSFEVGPEIVN